MSGQEEMQKNNAKRTLLIAVTLLTTGVFVFLRFESTQRGPVELNYCTNGINYGTPQVQCTEYKTLMIPWIYYSGYPNGIQHPVTKQMLGKIRELVVIRPMQNLEVAYPSMQPWNSVPLWQRWSTQKIEIDFEGGSLTSQTPRDGLATYFLGTPKPSHVPGSLYGLDQYLEEPWHSFQYLLPLEPNPRAFLRCGYKANGDLQNEQILGCTATTYTPWHLKLTLHHKRILLSQWADIHAKTQALIQSFVVTPNK